MSAVSSRARAVAAGGRAPVRLTWARHLTGALVAILLLTLWLATSGTDAARAAPLAPPDATPPTHGAHYEDGPTDRWLLGGAWLFRADPSNVGITQGFARPSSSTDGWSPVTVPNSWNTGDFSPASHAGSIGWYRRDFTLPAHAFARYVPRRFRSWIVRFESVNYDATVWLNGRRIGHHSGAYIPFELRLRGLRPGANELVVRVDSVRGKSALPPGPGGAWWNFGGLQREVYLRAVGKADLTPVVVRPTLPCPTCSARVHEQVTVRNPTAAAQTITLSGRYGRRHVDFGGHTIPAHSSWVADTSVRVPHPHLWSPDAPYLYTATLAAADARGRVLETYRVQSGIRSITRTRAGGLELNGRPLDLRGFALHEQSLSTGAALSPAQSDQLVAWDRALGGGIIRAHYPLSPRIEQDADRDGILLWSEIPVYQTPARYLTRPGWLRAAHDYLRTNILTNENHPSILVWSIANELTVPDDDAETAYVAGATALAHQLDPTRPVGIAADGWPGLGCQASFRPLDVIGFNDYFGWFDSGGGTADDLDALPSYLDSLHACYPHQALMVTEFGYEGSRDGPVEVRGTFANQAAMAQESLSVFATKPYLTGVIWFALQDFAAFPGWTGGDPFGNPPFVQKGPIDINGNPREPLYDTLSAAYHATTQIAPP
jgi:beta-glucuronidase